jgi:hypothetical protein
MAKAGTIRGLQVFISDIRACQNKEQETRRVDKELAKIRGKFGDDKKTLTGAAASSKVAYSRPGQQAGLLSGSDLRRPFLLCSV